MGVHKLVLSQLMNIFLVIWNLNWFIQMEVPIFLSAYYSTLTNKHIKLRVERINKLGGYFSDLEILHLLERVYSLILPSKQSNIFMLQYPTIRFFVIYEHVK